MRRTVVLADDHALFRQGVRSLIESEFDVVGEARDGNETIPLVTSTQPDVLLLDVEMPGPTAEQTLSRIRRAAPSTAVVILTMHSDAVLERQLLRAGASQFISKTVDGSSLRNIVANVRASSVVATPSFANELHGPEILTSRELEVLRMVSQAYTNRDISQRLRIAEGTVKRHTTNIYAKLGATSRIDAVRKAARLNLLGN